jgi:alanine racemase
MDAVTSQPIAVLTSQAHVPAVECIVDLDAIAHNVRVLKEFAGDADVMAVVKADGYNHGAVEVARVALASGASELGVTNLQEALALRAAGITAPILSWLNPSDADWAPAIEAGIEIGVTSIKHLHAVAAAAAEAGRATITVKVDTGLNRNGVASEEYSAFLDELVKASRAGLVELRGVFSHLAHADEPYHPTIDVQRQRFIDAIDQARAAGLDPQKVHLANSAATVTRPDLHFDMVRPGIAVYGLSPVPEEGTFGLRPAMTFRARVVLVKKVHAGEGVSYGHDWIAPADTTVALLPAGYADGIPRAMKGRFEVVIGGIRYPAIGRVCMDQVVVNLGDNPGSVSEGDEALFFGTGDRGEQTAHDWAEAMGTIHYEIVCGIRGRTVRRYVGSHSGGGGAA